MLYIICEILCVEHWVYMILLCLGSIHDQLHTVTENLQLLSAEVRSKLQDNMVLSLDGGILVDRSLQNIQLADVVNKVFNV